MTHAETLVVRSAMIQVRRRLLEARKPYAILTGFGAVLVALGSVLLLGCATTPQENSQMLQGYNEG